MYGTKHLFSQNQTLHFQRGCKYCNNYNMGENWKDWTQRHVDHICQQLRDVSVYSLSLQPVELQPEDQRPIRLMFLRRGGVLLKRCRPPDYFYGPRLDPVWMWQWWDGFLGQTNMTRLVPYALFNILKAFPAIHHQLRTPAETSGGWTPRQLCLFIWSHCCSWFGLCTLPCRALPRRLPCRWRRSGRRCAGRAEPAPTLSSLGSAPCLAHLKWRKNQITINLRQSPTRRELGVAARSQTCQPCQIIFNTTCVVLLFSTDFCCKSITLHAVLSPIHWLEIGYKNEV